MTDQTEVRITNEATGGQKGQKAERFDLIPAGPMEAVARHYGIGARKYDDDNWRKGYSWRLTLGALERHLNKIKKGEDIDVDTLPDGTVVESPHAAAIVFHALALLEFAETHPELDDRWKPEPKPEPERLTWIQRVDQILSQLAEPVPSLTLEPLTIDWLDPAPIHPFLRSFAEHPSSRTHDGGGRLVFDVDLPPLSAADPTPSQTLQHQLYDSGRTEAPLVAAEAEPEPYVPAVGDTICTREGFNALPKGAEIAYSSGINRATKVGRGSWQTTLRPHRTTPTQALSLNGGWKIESLPEPEPKYAGGDRISVRDVIRAFTEGDVVVQDEEDFVALFDPDYVHDNAVKILDALEEEGYEVTYAGGRVTPEPEVKVVPQDTADWDRVRRGLEGTAIEFSYPAFIESGAKLFATLIDEDKDVQAILDALDKAGLRIVEKA